MIVNEDQAYFDHHLYHDYLAARHVAAHLELWNDTHFDAITFGASSFDTIALVLQQLDLEQTDIFLKRVYDWNPYAAAYALSDTENSTTTPETLFVISAMLADRLDDLLSRDCPTLG